MDASSTARVKSLLDVEGREAGGPLIRVLDQNEMEILLRLVFTEKDSLKVISFADPVKWSHPDIGKSFPIQVIAARLAAFTPQVQITEGTILLVAALCKTAGECVMWTYTLFRLHEQRGAPVTVEAWCNAFPLGVPTDDAMRTIWKMQKSTKPGQDNLLDIRETWCT